MLFRNIRTTHPPMELVISLEISWLYIIISLLYFQMDNDVFIYQSIYLNYWQTL